MAKELFIGLAIGAALKGSFTQSFRSANKTINQLGAGLGKALQKQERLGNRISKAQTSQLGLQQKISHALLTGDGSANKLIRRYERMQGAIGKALEKQMRFTTAIQKAEKAQTSLSNAVERQEKRRENREKLKSDMISSTAMTASVVMPAWASVKTYIEQEEASNNLKVAMMKKDGSFGRFNEIDKLTEELGKQLPGTKAKFTQEAIALISQGISEDVIYKGGLKTAAELGVVMDMGQPGESGEFLAKFMEARGLTEEELSEAADMLQRAKFAGGLSREQMYGSMSYNASTIRSLKLTGKDNTKKLLAMEGLAGQQGLEGTSFGTNFSTFLDRLNEGPKMLAVAKKGMKAEARDMMNASGVDLNFFDKNGKFKGLDETIRELMKFQKIKAKFGDEGVGLVAKELFGVEGARVAKVLIEQGEDGLAKFLARMDEQTSLTQRIAQKTSTLGSALESLGGVWETAFGTIGSAFADDIKEFSALATSLIENKLTPWLKENKSAVKWFVGVAAGLTMVSTAVLAFKFAFSGIASIFGAITMPIHLFKAGKAVSELNKVNGKMSLFSKIAKKVPSVMRGLGKSFGFVAKGFLGLSRAILTNPIGLAITAIAVGAYLIYSYWEPIKAFFGNLWDWVSQKFNGAWEGIRSAWSGVSNWVSNAWAGVKDFFGNLWHNVTTAFEGGLQALGR